MPNLNQKTAVSVSGGRRECRLATTAAIGIAFLKKAYLSPMFVLFIAAQAHASALSDLAASMQPGTWAELTTNNINPVMRTGASPNNSWMNTAGWDGNRGILQFLGKDAGPVGYTHVAYRESNNTWSIEGTTLSGEGGHGY